VNTSTSPSVGKPAFLITIDVEGDSMWSKPHHITTRNSRFLNRFQTICEHHGLKPTYLTNWEMVNCPVFVELAKDALTRGQAEIGAHLHPWNQPPLYSLTADDMFHQPFVMEYPNYIISEKLKVLTAKLEETFGVKMVSHRSGRWSMNEVYARGLLQEGYLVDCSVTPHVSWRAYMGDPSQKGGTDYRSFPDTAYFMDLSNIKQPVSKEGCFNTLLELPMTITPAQYGPLAAAAKKILRAGGKLGRRAAEGFFPSIHWLRPNGRNAKTQLALLDWVIESGRDYAEFMLHSSEFMPGGSPKFKSERSIERLYEELEELFSNAAKRFEGMTLQDYHRRICPTPARLAIAV
jgi:hypothetical protein